MEGLEDQLSGETRLKLEIRGSDSLPRIIIKHTNEAPKLEFF